jgi:hypothetical protein
MGEVPGGRWGSDSANPAFLPLPGQVCGKMVMGYEKEKHVKNVYAGLAVEWKKVK